ncbi:MAG: VOC family protein [Betaproteobacteria bacterium]
MIHIDRIDHVVLTVRSIAATTDFYRRTLGMSVVKFAGGRVALGFGQQKFNLHEAGHEFEPKADRPAPGSADFCLVTATPIADVIAHLKREEVEILEGPVDRTGAIGRLLSVYFRDPDLNLVEVANLVEGASAALDG